MSDLFMNLYRYRERINKSNLEDWLTECLAATIRHLPVELQSLLLAGLTGLNAHEIETAIEVHELDIRTQYQAGQHGRPDMLLLLGRVDKGYPQLD